MAQVLNSTRSADSRQAAGVLETMGYRAAAELESADLVLFNTCAIRENADNKLYGQLTQLRPLKLADPDKTLVVGGCLAQKDQATLAAKVPWVDVVYGTHNMGSLPRLLAQADSVELPVVEILKHTETFPTSASTCTCRCSRAATPCCAACSARTVRRATSISSPRPGRRSPVLPSRPTSSWASPARPRRTSPRPCA